MPGRDVGRAEAYQLRGAESVTPFAAILKARGRATPDAIGGAFADADGEMVDSFTTIDRTSGRC